MELFFGVENGGPTPTPGSALEHLYALRCIRLSVTQRLSTRLQREASQTRGNVIGKEEEGRVRSSHLKQEQLWRVRCGWNTCAGRGRAGASENWLVDAVLGVLGVLGRSGVLGGGRDGDCLRGARRRDWRMDS